MQLIDFHTMILLPTGLQFLYFLSQTPAAPYITYFLSNLAPMGPAAPLLQLELTSDPAELEVIKRDPRM